MSEATKEDIGKICMFWDDSDGAKAFDIAPADDWTKSLIKVGGK